MRRRCVGTVPFRAGAGAQHFAVHDSGGHIYLFVIRSPGYAVILAAMLEKELSYSISNGAKQGVVILALEGPFTLSNMFQLQGEMRSLKAPCLIMDMTQVPYMDSAGLGVIMNYFVSAQ